MANDRPGLFRLHSIGAAYGQRPSKLVGIADEWAAHQFDAACLSLGRRVEQAVIKGEDVSALLKDEVGKPAPGQFRSPAGRVVKRLKIPASGVW